MKRRFLLLFVLILTLIMGWVLGYLRLPNLKSNFNFWIGFGAAFVLILYLFFFHLIWYKKWVFRKRLKIETDSSIAVKMPDKGLRFWPITSVVVVVLSLFWVTKLQLQNNSLRQETKMQKGLLLDLERQKEAIRDSKQTYLLSNLLDIVDDEVKRNSNGFLSDSVIARIAAIGNSFKPYAYLDGDSLLTEKLSPERGKLLISLILAGVDTASFSKIIGATTFAKADLRGADLRGANLSGIDLRGANLSSANLSKAIIIGADLSRAVLRGTKLNNSNLSRSDMTRVDLSWAEMNGSNMSEVNFTGSNLESCQMREANVHGSTFQWSSLVGALMMGADCTEADLARSDLRKANLTKANLNGSRLAKARLENAIMIETQLHDVDVEPNWLEMMTGWHISGSNQVLVKYHIISRIYPQTQGIRYYLMKIEKD